MWNRRIVAHFPSFSEGLSLRAMSQNRSGGISEPFPFLFGGTFIEGTVSCFQGRRGAAFPFLFGGTFIEGYLRLTLDGALHE